MNKFNVKSDVLHSHSNYNIISIHNNNNNNKKTMKTATKMYLSIILSMVCIMFYQYQLSKANFVTWQGGGGNGNTNSGVVTTNRMGIESNEVLLKVNLLPLNNSEQSVAPSKMSDISEEEQSSIDGNSLDAFEMFNANENGASLTFKSIETKMKKASVDDGDPTNVIKLIQT